VPVCKEPVTTPMRPPVATIAPRNLLRGTLLRVGGPALLIVLLSACMLPPEPKTEAAEEVFNLYVAILVLAGIVFIGVEGFILYAVVRYRRKAGDDVLPQQVHGNNLIEIIWTAIPTVIVLILFILSMFTLGTVNARDESPNVVIQVESFQWQWRFLYDGGVTVTGTAEEPPRLTVPVGEPVRVVLNSTDVIHSFFVPNFLIKRDAVPVAAEGSANELEFTVTEAGTYSGQCAEFCGTGHNDMTFIVDAKSRADYDAWYTAAQAGETPPPPEPGECQTTIELSAANVAFDTDTIEAPAGAEFCIAFTNDDTIPHDVGILQGDTEIFNGEDIPGGESIVYLIPALEPGDYEFLCTLHPDLMVGSLTAAE
jgi:cytochrome c oxidase subunit II